MGTYVVTGSSSGIGAAVFKDLLDEGHRVVTVGRRDAEITADLADKSDRLDAVAKIITIAKNGIDGFIPCAGIGPDVHPRSLVVRVNYFAVFDMIDGLIDLLARKNGGIVLISSNSAAWPCDQEILDALQRGNESIACELVEASPESDAHYRAAKHAMILWMRRNCSQLLGRGIRINAVAAGITDTPLTSSLLESESFGLLFKDFKDSIPIGYMANPHDIANVVRFLLDPLSRFVSGAHLYVDGGHDAAIRPANF